MKRRIASWNVNSIKARLPLVLQWLRECVPDVVLLQEIKVITEDFPSEYFEDLGYNVAIFGQKTYNGVSILSKYPLEDVRRGFNDNDSGGPSIFAQARYLEAVTGGMRVASVYVPNGQALDSEKFSQKLTFLEGLQTHVRELLKFQEILIIGGDYNIAPQDQDIQELSAWKDGIMCSTPERKAFYSLENTGLKDAFRLLEPDAEGYTWWDYRTRAFARNAGLRIDHMLVSAQAADLLVSCGVNVDTRGWERPSDHAPVWIELSGSF